jgi:SAM-dependent methyltransferase
MTSYRYYRDNLAAGQLEQAYELAPPRIRQYLEAEIGHVVDRIRPGDVVLELGCGYGRILERLATKARVVVGVDNSLSSLGLGKSRTRHDVGILWICTDASRPGLRPGAFDCVVCIQNGISAFHVDRRTLIAESINLARRGGLVLFSSYSERIWGDRLKWFELQADAGLVGEIDYARTGKGIIVCKDGFTAGTVSPEEFARLTEGLNVDSRTVEIDGSSLFCEIKVR